MQRDDRSQGSPQRPDTLVLLEKGAGVLGPVLRHMAYQPRWLTVLESVAAVGLVAWLDVVTPSPESILPILYLLPIITATWFVSWRWGSGVAVLATAMWLGHDLLVGTEATGLMTLASVVAVRLTFFLVPLALVNGAKNGLLRERSYARTDALTGAANVRAFEERLEFSLAYLRRTGLPLTLAYLDIDDFKAINDKVGHSEGDAVLRAVAEAIAGRLRSTDLLARLGGDEFCVILPDTGSTAALRAVTEMTAAIEAGVGEHRKVTQTIGVVTFVRPPADTDAMVRAADQLMYEGKHQGKARVCAGIWPDGNVACREPSADRPDSA